VEPRSRVLAPNLERWLVEAGGGDAAESGGERRTLVVRLPAAADPERAADRLRDVGASVQTTGEASITVDVTRAELRRLLDEPWIVAIEEPRRLFPSAGPDVPDI
jgi:hypothetical protein